MDTSTQYPRAILPPATYFTIRCVTPDDAERLHTYLWQDRPLEEIRDFISRVMKFREQKRGVGIVATNGDFIIAYGQTTLWMQCAEISDLMVAPAYRSQGIGTAMIQYLTRYSATHKINCVELGVAQANPRAFKLYRQLGFKESYKLHLDLGDGQEPVIYLSLDLTPYH